MQIPFGWEIQVVPGSLYLLAVFLWVWPRNNESLIKYARNNAILVVPLIVIFAYIAAMTADYFVAYPIRYVVNVIHHLPDKSPPTDYPLATQYADPKLLEEFGNEYKSMLFFRSLFFSWVFFSIAVSYRICRSASARDESWRSLVSKHSVQRKVFFKWWISIFVIWVVAVTLFDKFLESKDYFLIYRSQTIESAKRNRQGSLG